jgi:ribonuclease BN (tRNA processing enzyme)
VKLTIVGCSGTMPGPDGPASCYLVEVDGFRLVLDLGHGSLGPLQQSIGISDIDAIVFTHLHPDHCIDLTALYVARAFGPYDISARLPVYGPPNVADRMADAYGMRRTPGMHSTFDFQPIGLTSDIGPFRVRTARMVHPVETYAVRLEAAGVSMVYSGDTGPTPDLAQLADGVELLLAEASFVDGDDNPADLHLTGKQAGEVANAAGVSHLVITHVPPWNDREVALAEARSTFDGATSLATSGRTIDVGR